LPRLHTSVILNSFRDLIFSVLFAQEGDRFPARSKSLGMTKKKMKD